MKSLRLIALLAAMVFCLIAKAEIDPKSEQAIRDSFKKSLPSLSIDEIQNSPITGVFQVRSGPVVMYVTQDGRYAISGDILDLSDGETNITENARKKARVTALEKLGTEHMVIYEAPNARHIVTVVTDIDCAYCRKFHQQIADINKRGITVRYLAFPRAGSKSTSYEKAVNVWCADDPKAAMTKAKQGHPVPAKTCDNHMIDEQFHFGVMAGVSGTPTMILEDGTLVPGYYDSENLLNILNSSKKELAKAKQH